MACQHDRRPSARQAGPGGCVSAPRAALTWHRERAAKVNHHQCVDMARAHISHCVVQQNSAHFEEGVVRALQTAWETFDNWAGR